MKITHFCVALLLWGLVLVQAKDVVKESVEKKLDAPKASPVEAIKEAKEEDPTVEGKNLDEKDGGEDNDEGEDEDEEENNDVEGEEKDEDVSDIAKEDEQLKDPLGYGTVGYQMVAPYTKVIYNTRNPYVTYGRRRRTYTWSYSKCQQDNKYRSFRRRRSCKFFGKEKVVRKSGLKVVYNRWNPYVQYNVYRRRTGGKWYFRRCTEQRWRRSSRRRYSCKFFDAALASTARYSKKKDTSQ
jgi:hypothetical protein